MKASAYPAYEVSVCPAVHGSILVRPAKAGAGERISVILTADEGYQMHPGSLIYLLEGEEVPIFQLAGDWSFVMPDHEVSVSVVFDRVSSVDDFKFDPELGEIVHYRGRGGHVVVPEQIQGKAVKRIKDFAFFHQNEILSMVLPHGLECIGKDAFSDCINLSRIEMPSTLTTIEEYAFAHCYKLEQLNLPESLFEVGRGVFFGCWKISDAVLSDEDSISSNT